MFEASTIPQLRAVRGLVWGGRLSRTRCRCRFGKHLFRMGISEPAERSIGMGTMGIVIVGQCGATAKYLGAMEVSGCN